MSVRGANSPKGYHLTTSAILLATTMLAGAGGAHAAATAAAASDSTGGSTALQEVIVTAQKRSENVQSVPANVQAFGTQKLEQLHISDFSDYIKFLPSVTYQSVGPSFSNVYMRGIAADNQSNHSGSMPSVGTYLDEQPITTIGGALNMHVYDIARVEALAGPQGTLYGASSEAGTIRIITNKPETGKFSAAIDIEGDTVDHGGQGGTVEGFVNIPVDDKIAVRLVGWEEADPGYINNVYGVRTYSTGVVINNAPYVKKDFNGSNTVGGRFEAKIDLNDNWTITPTVIAQGERNTGVYGYEPNVGVYDVQHFGPDWVRDHWYQASLTIQGKISDFDLVYSGGYMDRRIDSAADYTDYAYAYDKAFGSAHYFHDNAGNYINPSQEIIGHDHFTKDSHELRISSPQSWRARFVAGLFYQAQQHYIIQDYQIQGLSDSNAEPGVLDLSVDGWPGTYWLTDQLRTDKDYAAFGEASFDITPKLTFTGGVRAYKATSTLEGFYGFGLNSPFTYNSNGTPGSSEAACFGPAILGGPCMNLDKHTSDTGETHKLNLTYHLTDDKLIYATYSTGFRPGGVNRSGNLPPYAPDYLTNYEAGWKTSWLENSLRWNGDVFYEQWRHFQFAYLGPNSLTVIANAGSASVFGVESDLNWRVTHALSLSASGSYIDSQLDEDFCPTSNGVCVSGGPTAEAYKGQSLPVTPKWKGNITARYQFTIGSFDAYVQGSAVAQSSSWSDLLLAERMDLGQQQGFGTADFSAGIAKNNWTIDFSVINAFDGRPQLYRYTECTIALCSGTVGDNYVVTEKPRTIALKLGAKF
jgi:outer membrane receptor protein involved in Fe transport